MTPPFVLAVAVGFLVFALWILAFELGCLMEHRRCMVITKRDLMGPPPEWLNPSERGWRS